MEGRRMRQSIVAIPYPRCRLCDFRPEVYLASWTMLFRRRQNCVEPTDRLPFNKPEPYFG